MSDDENISNEISWNDPKVLKVMTFLEETSPKDDLWVYYIKLMGTMLANKKCDTHCRKKCL